MFNQELYVSAFARAVHVLRQRSSTKDQQKAALRALVALAELQAASLRLYDGGLSVDDQSLPDSIPHLALLIERMQAHGIQELLIGRQSEPAELLALLRGLAAEPGQGGSIKERLRDAGSTRVMVVLEAPAGRPGRRPASVTQAFEVADIAKAEEAAALEEWEKFHSSTEHAINLAFDDMEPAPAAATPDAPRTSGERPSEAAAEAPVLPLPAETPLGGALSAVVLDPYGRGILDRLTLLGDRIRGALAEDRVEEALRAISIAIDLEAGAPEGTPRNSYGIMLKRLFGRELLAQVAQCLLSPGLQDAAAKVILRSRDEGVEVLLGLLATAEGMRERKAYMAVLRQTKDGVSQVIHMLGHEQWFVVRNVAELVGEMRIEEAVGELGRLLGHGDHRVRRAAASALAKIGTPATVEPLRRTLKEGDAELRQMIAGSIGKSSRALAMPLVALLESEENQDVVREYYLALGRIGTPDCVLALKKAAEPGGRLVGRKPAAQRVGAVQALRIAGAMQVLRALADDSDRTVRDAVRQALDELVRGGS
jgi:hypothetical protein